MLKNSNSQTIYTSVIILFLFILILLYIIFKRINHNIEFLNIKQYNICQCNNCKIRIKNFCIENRNKNVNKTLYFYILIFILIFIIFINLVNKIQYNFIHSINPYEILNLTENSTINEINNNFKNLRDFYNNNNKSNYNLISNLNYAYSILTNDHLKKNYFKKFEFFPKQLNDYFINNINSKKIYKILFVLFLILITPETFNKLKNNIKNDLNLNDNKSIFYYFLDNNLNLQNLPFILGLGLDLNINVLKSEEKYINEYINILNNNFPIIYKNIENIPFGNLKSICILYSHFFGQKLKFIKNNDYSFVIKTADLYLDLILEMCLNLHKNYYFYHKLNSKKEYDEINIKYFDYNFIKKIIYLKQYIYQSCDIILDNKENEFLQLPLIYNNKVLENFKDIKNLKDLKNKMKNINNKYESIENYNNIKESLNNIPFYSLNSDIEIFKYDFGDLIGFNHEISNNNFNNKLNGFLHSNTFPDKIKEKIILIILDEKNNNIIDFYFYCFINKSSVNYQNFILPEKFGENKFKIELFSLNFIGINNTQTLTINVKENKEIDLYQNFIKNYINNISSEDDIKNNYKHKIKYKIKN